MLPNQAISFSLDPEIPITWRYISVTITRSRMVGTLVPRFVPYQGFMKFTRISRKCYLERTKSIYDRSEGFQLMAARAGTIIIVSAACIAMISGCGKAHDSNALDQQSDAILRAVPNTVEFVNNAPRNCVEVGIKLSNDEMFAKVWVKHKRANCAGYGGNSYVILRKHGNSCLLYTSDAADDLLCVDLGGRRII